MGTLNELFNNFYKPSGHAALNVELEQNHQELIKALSKEDRPKVLRIIDSLMMIASLQTEESFIQGFRLGVNLTNELQSYRVPCHRGHRLDD